MLSLSLKTGGLFCYTDLIFTQKNNVHPNTKASNLSGNDPAYIHDGIDIFSGLCAGDAAQAGVRRDRLLFAET